MSSMHRAKCNNRAGSGQLLDDRLQPGTSVPLRKPQNHRQAFQHRSRSSELPEKTAGVIVLALDLAQPQQRRTSKRHLEGNEGTLAVSSRPRAESYGAMQP